MMLLQDSAATATRIGEPNVVAMAFFFLFIVTTLGITYWAARRTKSAADFYAAGGGITGFQNGLAIAGDGVGRGGEIGPEQAEDERASGQRGTADPGHHREPSTICSLRASNSELARRT